MQTHERFNAVLEKIEELGRAIEGGDVGGALVEVEKVDRLVNEWARSETERQLAAAA